MNKSDNPPAKTTEATPEVDEIRQGIENTRSEMSGTLAALEQRLQPSEIRGKVAVELEHIEARVKGAVKEELQEVKVILRDELKEAKASVHEVVDHARQAVKEDVIAAKDAVTREVGEALTRAKHAAREATLGRLEDAATQAGDVMIKTRDTLVETVRQNPIPAVLVGVGIAWLLMNRSSSASSRRTSERGFGAGQFGDSGFDGASWRHGQDDAHGSQPVGRAVSKAQHAVAGLAHDVTDATGRAVHGASDAAGRALHGATDAAGRALHGAVDAAGTALHATTGAIGSAADAAGHLVHDASSSAGLALHGATDAISHVAGQIPGQARRAEQAAARAFSANPLAVGAVVLAAGTIVGLSLPRTEREDALLGETRNQLLEGVKGVAHKAAEAVQHLGEDAASNVKGALNAAS